MRRQPNLEKRPTRSLKVEWLAVSIGSAVLSELNADKAKEVATTDMLSFVIREIGTLYIQRFTICQSKQASLRAIRPIVNAYFCDCFFILTTCIAFLGIAFCLSRFGSQRPTRVLAAMAGSWCRRSATFIIFVIVIIIFSSSLQRDVATTACLDWRATKLLQAAWYIRGGNGFLLG